MGRLGLTTDIAYYAQFPGSFPEEILGDEFWDLLVQIDAIYEDLDTSVLGDRFRRRLEDSRLTLVSP